MVETIFQAAFRRHDEWEAQGCQGNAPARIAFRHPDVSALVDPFRKLPGTLVVIPKEANPGGEHHMADLSPTRRMQMALVCLEFGKKMIDATGLRAIEHTEGYGVPDHAHTVIFPGPRGEGKALYERVELPEETTLSNELDLTSVRFGIVAVEAVVLRRKLDLVASTAQLFDDFPPLGVANGLQEFSARVSLAT